MRVFYGNVRSQMYKAYFNAANAYRRIPKFQSKRPVIPIEAKMESKGPSFGIRQKTISVL